MSRLPIRCVQYTCEEKAYYLIVYGCYDFHIRELLLCWQHGEEWAMKQGDRLIACAQCHQLIEAYEFTYTENLHAMHK